MKIRNQHKYQDDFKDLVVKDMFTYSVKPIPIFVKPCFTYKDIKLVGAVNFYVYIMLTYGFTLCCIADRQGGNSPSGPSLSPTGHTLKGGSCFVSEATNLFA